MGRRAGTAAVPAATAHLALALAIGAVDDVLHSGTEMDIRHLLAAGGLQQAPGCSRGRAVGHWVGHSWVGHNPSLRLHMNS